MGYKPKKKKTSYRNGRGEKVIMGRNCLQELMNHFPERLVKVFTSQVDEHSPMMASLQQLGVPVKRVSKRELFSLVNSDSHQSFVAFVKENEPVDLPSFLDKAQEQERSLVLMLDSINDPQNFGALLRAAECFAVDAVVWSKNRGVDVTPVVSKASAGASELVELIKVANLVETMKKFGKAGYTLITAEVTQKSESLYSYAFPEKTLLIMGSEGRGVQPLISKNADCQIHIPMKGKISSLNVSQAASTFLSQWQRQKSGC